MKNLPEKTPILMIFAADRSQQALVLATHLRASGVPLELLAETTQTGGGLLALERQAHIFLIVASQGLAQSPLLMQLVNRLVQAHFAGEKLVLPIWFHQPLPSMGLLNDLRPVLLYGPSSNQQANRRFLARQFHYLLNALRPH